MARILLTEPDPAIREFMAGILTEFSHDVIGCESLVEASVWVATAAFDVLVTDLALRTADGLGLTRSCAEHGIRMVTLTGREFVAGQTEVVRPPTLLEKPFRFSDLQRVLEAVETPRSAAVDRNTTSAA